MTATTREKFLKVEEYRKAHPNASVKTACEALGFGHTNYYHWRKMYEGTSKAKSKAPRKAVRKARRSRAPHLETVELSPAPTASAKMLLFVGTPEQFKQVVGGW